MDLEKNKLGLGSKPAIIVVDMINGFTDPACPLGCDCPDVVDANRQLLDAFREKLLPVYFTTVIYRNNNQASVFRKKLPALNVLEPDSHWVKVDAKLSPQPEEKIIEKRWASAFFDTGLDQLLKAEAVDSLLVTGLTTSGCVRATAVDGLQYNYKVVIAEEAVGDRNQDAHKANLFDINQKYGDVLKLKEVLQLVNKLNVN